MNNTNKDKIKRYSFIGVEIDALTFESLTKVVTYAIEKKKKWFIAHHNLHSLYVYHHDAQTQKYYANARYIHAEGMGVIVTAKLLGINLKKQNRIAYVDWFPSFLSLAAHKKWKIFYLGSKPGVAKKAVALFKNNIPDLNIHTHHGHFDVTKQNQENDYVIAQIKAYAPELLFVGMGMPRQEQWIVDNYSDLPANVIFNVGALMDYFGEEKAMAPRWMGQIGLEWLYRLFSEPKRLWKRYLIEPWYILGLLLQTLIRKLIVQKK